MRVFWGLMGAMVLAAQPVLADQMVTGIHLMRDSDGIVISVLYPVDYYVPWVRGGDGEVIYMMDGHVLEFSSSTTDTPGIGPVNSSGVTTQVGGTTFDVVQKGQDIWLQDPQTGLTYPTVRHSSVASGAAGLAVNPNGFALD